MKVGSLSKDQTRYWKCGGFARDNAGCEKNKYFYFFSYS